MQLDSEKEEKYVCRKQGNYRCEDEKLNKTNRNYYNSIGKRIRSLFRWKKKHGAFLLYTQIKYTKDEKMREGERDRDRTRAIANQKKERNIYFIIFRESVSML